MLAVNWVGFSYSTSRVLKGREAANVVLERYGLRSASVWHLSENGYMSGAQQCPVLIQSIPTIFLLVP